MPDTIDKPKRPIRVYKPGDVLPDDTNQQIRQHAIGLMKALRLKFPRDFVRIAGEKPLTDAQQTG